MRTEKDILELPPLPFCKGCAGRDRMILALAKDADRKDRKITELRAMCLKTVKKVIEGNQLKAAVQTMIEKAQ